MNNKTQKQISYNMRRIKHKDSIIETILRKELWNRGLHYRKNVRTIFGAPDIVFVRLKVAVFCDSEFWHGYNWEEQKKTIKSNRDFWIPKIECTIKRDQEVTKELESDGWTVLRFWGKTIRYDASSCADLIEAKLKELKN